MGHGGRGAAQLLHTILRERHPQIGATAAAAAAAVLPLRAPAAAAVPDTAAAPASPRRGRAGG